VFGQGSIDHTNGRGTSMISISFEAVADNGMIRIPEQYAQRIEQ